MVDKKIGRDDSKHFVYQELVQLWPAGSGSHLALCFLVDPADYRKELFIFFGFSMHVELFRQYKLPSTGGYITLKVRIYLLRTTLYSCHIATLQRGLKSFTNYGFHC